MAHDELPLVGQQDGSSSVALLPANVIEHHPVEWNGAALTEPAPPPTMDVFAYVHALRRHWLMAFGIGILCAAAIGPAVWFGVGDRYTASAFLRVAIQDKPIAFNTDPQAAMDRDRFEIYKSTQQQLVLSRFVLMAALRRPEVTKLPCVQEAQKETDAAAWLAKYSAVSFPGKAEIMEIDVTRRDAQEATTLVRAVVDAYMKEVVESEREQKRGRLNELDRAFVEKETEIRTKREDLKKLADTLGTSDSETLNMKQKLALEMLSLYRQEAAKSQFEVRRQQSELAAMHALLKSIDAADVTDAELETLLQSDPVARQLFVELGWRKLDQVYMEGAVVSGARTRMNDRSQQDIKTMQEQYDARRAELADMLRQKNRSKAQMDVQRLEAGLAVATEQQQAQQKSVEEQQREAERFGSSTVDIEMMRADIKNLEGTLSALAGEREKLRVEVHSTPRITTPFGRAEPPELPSNYIMKIASTILGMLVGFCAPAAAIVLLDIKAKHINSADDVSRRLRLSVIGWMPLIPARVIRRLGSPSRKNKTWHMRLTESVDGIAARVLRKADTEQCRVIMISSAAGGEGKTTLATQLAMSLARAGRRTVLVDFDLRRPAFDEVFGLPLEPGVCEVLRQKDPVSAFVHQTADNLAVVTAGRWDRGALASLSNGAAAAMFKQLREDYDFVVVDTSPILPVADARFVSQHVDSVVLSIFRDVSQTPKIEAACEILAAFGVNTLEAVVTGPNSNMYGRHMGYESIVSA